METAFKTRWPRQVLVAQTTEQMRQRLRSERLKKEDIRVMIFLNGVEMMGQARWAKQDTISCHVGRGSNGGTDTFSKGEHACSHEDTCEGFV